MEADDYTVERDKAIQKYKLYLNYDGNIIHFNENVKDVIYEKWLKVPDDVKSEALIPMLTYKRPDKALYSYEVEYLNSRIGTEYDEYISRYKSLALDQIYFSEQYFPSKEEFYNTCDEALKLPDDKFEIYKFLHSKSMLNLRYDPNRISLVSDCMQDPVNINQSEMSDIMNEKHIGFDDIIAFPTKDANFSKSNYIKNVDLLMNILGGRENDGSRFRKTYQLYNAIQNANSYYDYNSRDYDYDGEVDPSFSYDKSVVDENVKMYFDNSPTEDQDILRLYLNNKTLITRNSYKLCKIFGPQAKNFMDSYMKIHNQDNLKESDPEFDLPSKKMSKEDIDYFSNLSKKLEEEELIENSASRILKVRAKINSLQAYILNEFPDDKISSKQHPTKVALSKEDEYLLNLKKNLLELIAVLPMDLPEEKWHSFSKFMQKKFFFKHKDGKKDSRPIDEVAKISRIWSQLTPSQELMKYDDMLSLATGGNYINAQMKEFEDIAKINNLPTNLFDIAQQSYIRGVNTPRNIPTNNEVNVDDITIRLMDVKDPSIMFAGQGFSCQSIGQAGSYTALSSVEDPYSRAMVIEVAGKPVGLSWIWTNEENIEGKKYTSLCIDNVEIASYMGDRIDDVMKGVKDISKQIADEHNIKRVTMGAKASHYSPSSYFDATEALGLPSSYVSQTPHSQISEKIVYGDSANQVLVYDNHNAREIPTGSKHKYEQVFIAKRDAYTITTDERDAALSVGDAAYPWKAEFREEDKNSQFMILYNTKKEVLGYALYSDADKHIHDVAVHPDSRHYAKNLLFPLLAHMKEQGGTWGAETRKDTSFALLLKAAERGSLNLKVKDGVMGIQGERLNVVEISFPSQEKVQESTNIAHKVQTQGQGK